MLKLNHCLTNKVKFTKKQCCQTLDFYAIVINVF